MEFSALTGETNKAVAPKQTRKDVFLQKTHFDGFIMSLVWAERQVRDNHICPTQQTVTTLLVTESWMLVWRPVSSSLISHVCAVQSAFASSLLVWDGTIHPI